MPLDGDERDRLLALRAATGENAAMHAAVLTTLKEASNAYRLQLRTSEIRSRVESTDHLEADERAVRASLDQLREWRCVDWVQDPSIRARSIEEYVRRHELWELTPLGSATLHAIESVLGATDEAGALQRTMFRQVRTSLEQLVAAASQGDAAGVYLHLRDLDLALGQLAANARELYATINRIAREERLDDHVFLLYKDQLIAYLQSFHDDLVRNRTLIATQLLALDATHRSEPTTQPSHLTLKVDRRQRRVTARLDRLAIRVRERPQRPRHQHPTHPTLPCHVSSPSFRLGRRRSLHPPALCRPEQPAHLTRPAPPESRSA